jgi:hypothetical protein
MSTIISMTVSATTQTLEHRSSPASKQRHRPIEQDTNAGDEQAGVDTTRTDRCGRTRHHTHVAPAPMI